MLQKHLDLTTGEVVCRLKKDWAADIKSYDEGHVHMLMFADMLTDGIVKQFPDKFKSKVRIRSSSFLLYSESRLPSGAGEAYPFGGPQTEMVPVPASSTVLSPPRWPQLLECQLPPDPIPVLFVEPY
jgi:hypothetical protein